MRKYTVIWAPTLTKWTQLNPQTMIELSRRGRTEPHEDISDTFLSAEIKADVLITTVLLCVRVCVCVCACAGECTRIWPILQNWYECYATGDYPILLCLNSL